jgi:hypothetical protein
MVGSYNNAYGSEPFVGGAKANVTGNYYIAGPDTDPYLPWALLAATPAQALWANEVHFGRNPAATYYSSNYADLDADSAHDGSRLWLPVPLTSTYVIEHAQPIDWPVSYLPVSASPTAADAYYEVIMSAGASIYWDDTDMRILSDVMTRYPSHGLISSPPPEELP